MHQFLYNDLMVKKILRRLYSTNEQTAAFPLASNPAEEIS